MSGVTSLRKQQQDSVKHNVKVAQLRQKQQYNQKHSKAPKYEGVKVFKKDFCRKKRKGGGLDNKWLGPYEILKDLGKGFFSLKSIESGQVIQRIHGAHLKRYFTPPNSPVPSDDGDSDSSEDVDCSVTSAGLGRSTFKST